MMSQERIGELWRVAGQRAGDNWAAQTSVFARLVEAEAIRAEGQRADAAEEKLACDDSGNGEACGECLECLNDLARHALGQRGQALEEARKWRERADAAETELERVVDVIDRHVPVDERPRFESASAGASHLMELVQTLYRERDQLRAKLQLYDCGDGSGACNRQTDYRTGEEVADRCQRCRLYDAREEWMAAHDEAKELRDKLAILRQQLSQARKDAEAAMRGSR